MSLLDEIARESGAALVTITHDLAVAARSGRHYRLADGVLVPVTLVAPDRPGSLAEWVGDVPTLGASTDAAVTAAGPAGGAA
jgi:putative ABC transport system ATP-binding protein